MVVYTGRKIRVLDRLFGVFSVKRGKNQDIVMQADEIINQYIAARKSAMIDSGKKKDTRT